MSNFAKTGLLAVTVLAAVAGVSAASGGAAAPEEILRDFQSADSDGDDKISLDEFKLLREKADGVADQNRASLPVYINGFERHYPRYKSYYLSSGAIFFYDEGPSRFYK